MKYLFCEYSIVTESSWTNFLLRVHGKTQTARTCANVIQHEPVLVGAAGTFSMKYELRSGWKKLRLTFNTYEKTKSLRLYHTDKIENLSWGACDDKWFDCIQWSTTREMVCWSLKLHFYICGSASGYSAWKRIIMVRTNLRQKSQILYSFTTQFP